ncbi:hypothetical protein C8R45DRAFT_1104992 [Mycena sanguinolenta]|nr:hypothetical protein C8R45DRAFT_1104992 [Mycena sanguinolenta]
MQRFCVSSSRWRPRERETLGREERRVHVANECVVASVYHLTNLQSLFSQDRPHL